ncbi:MAG: glycosyltransferase [Pseudomonadales bacterium]|jgi:GT2 family glycosyltransferase
MKVNEMCHRLEQVDVVFVLLTYANSEDLPNCLNSIKRNVDCSYRLIVVNSYYDSSSSAKIRKIAAKNGALFEEVENNGYGAGNNAGIRAARRHYDFKFLVVSNPDVEICFFPHELLADCNEPLLLGPLIRTGTAKNQNPYWPYYIPVVDFFVWLGCKWRSKLLYFTGVAVNKIARLWFSAKTSATERPAVYALHGSFLIFSRTLLDLLEDPFDERIFLYSEEVDLAHRIYELDAKVRYDDRFQVLHHEDGSSSFVNLDEIPIRNESIIYVYEKWKSRRRLAKRRRI